MICSKCKKQNNQDANFCRFCGTDLSKFVTPDLPKEKFISIKIPKINFRKFFQQFTKRTVLLVLILIFVGGGSVFAAPKISDYLAVNKILKNIDGAEEADNYASALAMINVADDLWMMESTRKKTEQLKEKENNYLNYQKLFNDARKKEEGGNLTEARDILNSINSDFPEYNIVQEKLAEIQSKIESELEAKVKIKEEEARREAVARAAAERSARAEAEAKKQAQAQAEAEAAAKRQAQAQAQAESAAKARAQAEADAAARAAREAEYHRQQEAIQRAEEVRKSFVNQLITGYNSYNQGVSYYNSAISYSNSGDSLLAISQASSTRAVLNTARNSVSDLNSRFTGLPSNYYTAASNMVSAIDYLNRALDLLVQSEGTFLDYSSSINSNKNLSATYANRVKLFLDSQ